MLMLMLIGHSVPSIVRPLTIETHHLFSNVYTDVIKHLKKTFRFVGEHAYTSEHKSSFRQAMAEQGVIYDETPL